MYDVITHQWIVDPMTTSQVTDYAPMGIIGLQTVQKVTSQHKETPYNQSAVGSVLFSVFSVCSSCLKRLHMKKRLPCNTKFCPSNTFCRITHYFLWILGRIKQPFHLRYMLTGTVSSEYKQKTQTNSSKLHVTGNRLKLEYNQRIPQLYPTSL